MVVVQNGTNSSFTHKGFLNEKILQSFTFKNVSKRRVVQQTHHNLIITLFKILLGLLVTNF